MFESSLYKKNAACGFNRPADLGGKLRIAHGFYKPDGTEKPGSVFKLATLPKGARVLALSKISFAEGQKDGLKISVGDAGKVDRYLESSEVKASGGSFALAAGMFDDFVTPAETVVTLTTAGAALAADALIVFDIVYVAD